MKTDIGGCSTCGIGQENYETFTGCFGRSIGKTFYQYEYRHQNGKLFTCVRKTLEECRELKNIWVKNLEQEICEAS